MVRLASIFWVSFPCLLRVCTETAHSGPTVITQSHSMAVLRGRADWPNRCQHILWLVSLAALTAFIPCGTLCYHVRLTTRFISSIRSTLKERLPECMSFFIPIYRPCGNIRRFIRRIFIWILAWNPPVRTRAFIFHLH